MLTSLSDVRQILHNLNENSMERTAESRPKKRIDDNVVMVCLLRQLFPTRNASALDKTRRRPVRPSFKIAEAANSVKVGVRIGVCFSDTAEQDYIDLSAGVEEFQSEGRTVAAVVPLAAKDLDVLAGEIT
jgi:hypothetical protein